MKYNSWLLLLAGQALAWNHASESELREALRQNAHTLVTCELTASCQHRYVH